MVGPVRNDGGGLPLLRPQEPSPRNLEDVIRTRAEEARRRIGDRAELRPSIEPEITDRSIRFRPLPELDVIQARVIDQTAGEVIREVPTTRRLEFVESFRRQLARNLGERFDLQA